MSSLLDYVCLTPELLAGEMYHLGKVLCYNNYPNWMIKQGSRNTLQLEDSSIRKEVMR